MKFLPEGNLNRFVFLTLFLLLVGLGAYLFLKTKTGSGSVFVVTNNLPVDLTVDTDLMNVALVDMGFMDSDMNVLTQRDSLALKGLNISFVGVGLWDDVSVVRLFSEEGYNDPVSGFNIEDLQGMYTITIYFHNKYLLDVPENEIINLSNFYLFASFQTIVDINLSDAEFVKDDEKPAVSVLEKSIELNKKYKIIK